MTYKEEGNGLQTYAIFHKGYTYQIFICNYPVSKKYLSKRISLLDDTEMEIFDTEEEKTTNARWIISTTQPHFKMQRTINIKNY